MTTTPTTRTIDDAGEARALKSISWPAACGPSRPIIGLRAGRVHVAAKAT
jgi:hypothetical protein